MKSLFAFKSFKIYAYYNYDKSEPISNDIKSLIYSKHGFTEILPLKIEKRVVNKNDIGWYVTCVH